MNTSAVHAASDYVMPSVSIEYMSNMDVGFLERLSSFMHITRL